jgi:pimeloyl-ACP methyl ester carboxylesterase
VKKTFFIAFICIFFLLATSLSPGILINDNEKQLDDPRPPNQPVSGPGGSDYVHNTVTKIRYNHGEKQYWIFEPNDPKPESAPLIVFIHGGGAFHPIFYLEWIYHIVKKGNILVYPRYQFGFSGKFSNYFENTIQAVKDAIVELQSNEHVIPSLDKFAIVGHSVGGGIAAYMAAVTEDFNLPIPKVIMSVQPSIPSTNMEDLSRISNKTLMLVLVGEDDRHVGNKSAKTIFYDTTQIPTSQKDFIIQRTDRYGNPDLVANHFAPVCLPLFNIVNAMDYYSTWKLFDALIDYAFFGINKEYCLGNTYKQRFMGFWSDGNPVKELYVTDNP